MFFGFGDARKALGDEVAFQVGRVTDRRQTRGLGEGIDRFEDEEARESAAEVGDSVHVCYVSK